MKLENIRSKKEFIPIELKLTIQNELDLKILISLVGQESGSSLSSVVRSLYKKEKFPDNLPNICSENLSIIYDELIKYKK